MFHQRGQMALFSWWKMHVQLDDLRVHLFLQQNALFMPTTSIGFSLWIPDAILSKTVLPSNPTSCVQAVEVLLCFCKSNKTSEDTLLGFKSGLNKMKICDFKGSVKDELIQIWLSGRSPGNFEGIHQTLSELLNLFIESLLFLVQS